MFFDALTLDVVGVVEDTANSIVQEVVIPAVEVAENIVETLEPVVMTVISLIETQFQRPQDVSNQQHFLDNIQANVGLNFPGHDYHSPDKKNWMAYLSVDKLTLNKIMWPGTHDSATNGIGIPIPVVGGSISGSLGECQTLSIFDQLVVGTRVLDIRVNEDRRVCHGIMTSYHVDIVLDDIIRFMSETQSEIIILEIRTESGKKDPPGFETYLVDKLGQLLIHQDDNLFNKLVSEILPKRVICIWKPRDSPRPGRGGLLWNSDYLKDDWTDTDLPWTKFKSNKEHLEQQPSISSRRFFYRVENTLTPQADNTDVGVRSVSGRIQRYARLFISWCISERCIDKLQIFSTDFIDGDFVDACVGLTHARIEGRV